jgi:hypothetical protein
MPVLRLMCEFCGQVRTDGELYEEPRCCDDAVRATDKMYPSDSRVEHGQRAIIVGAFGTAIEKAQYLINAYKQFLDSNEKAISIKYSLYQCVRYFDCEELTAGHLRDGFPIVLNVEAFDWECHSTGSIRTFEIPDIVFDSWASVHKYGEELIERETQELSAFLKERARKENEKAIKDIESLIASLKKDQERYDLRMAELEKKLAEARAK